MGNDWYDGWYYKPIKGIKMKFELFLKSGWPAEIEADDLDEAKRHFVVWVKDALKVDDVEGYPIDSKESE